MVVLSVNVNKIATLRNARGGSRPDVTEAARTALEAGADGITVHPRPDERHIRRQDVLDLAAILTVEFNIEGYPSPELLDLVTRVKPAQCTLVPDPPDVITSNAGWDLAGDVTWLGEVLDRLRGEGIRSSLFLDPDPAQVRRAAEIGTDRIELYTEDWARAHDTDREDETLARYRRAAEEAVAVGLAVNAGHDLDQDNLPRFAREIPGLVEVSIGHAIVCDALRDGLAPTVRAYKRILVDAAAS